MSTMEVWAGVECTVNRVNDVYHDQLERSGHATREADLEHIGALGVSAVRYPILWERVERSRGVYDFAWADARLEGLRRLGVRPIVGLVHHGSGPRWTSLLDPEFAEGLAAFAEQTARRFPWVDDFTPVNEPLTTARFSALYGHWYPHERGDRAFARALYEQTRATVLAMRAIRAVNPRARLVQTEDAGSVMASSGLVHQARFENLRKWASLDLLTGKVVPSHPLHRWFVDAGLSREELAFLADASCPPDVIGLNYYVTSDRFLDEHHEGYPDRCKGGNGRQVYADVEAVRVPLGIRGHERVLVDTWERYRIPVAITEVHIGCSVDEQVRWLVEAYRGATAAVRRGVDVRAVTAWAVFGTHDWNSLVTRADGHYEPGLFDVSSGEPRATELASAVRDLAMRGAIESPYLSETGWWRREGRVLYECGQCTAPLSRTGENPLEAA